MFQYVLPVAATTQQAASKPDDNKPGEKKPQGDDKEGIRTQAIPEKPGDDLGYDPKKIPVEEIPDD